ncbi:MAG: ATP-binding protein [Bradymonadia bacterium]
MNATTPLLGAPGKAIMTLVERAIHDHQLISPGDRIAVGISGGKDSLLLACAFKALSQRSDLDFEWCGVHLDQHQPGFARDQFNAAIEALEIPLQVVSEDTWSVVESKLAPGQIPCALCGRMRRGILNRWCAEHGFNTLALGHHLDDAIETFFLNLLFQRKLDPLKPATSASAHPVTTIRPLILVEERKIVDWRDRHGLLPVPCPVCDSFPESRRRDLKRLLEQFKQLQPHVAASIRGALYDRS